MIEHTARCHWWILLIILSMYVIYNVDNVHSKYDKKVWDYSFVWWYPEIILFLLMVYSRYDRRPYIRYGVHWWYHDVRDFWLCCVSYCKVRGLLQCCNFFYKFSDLFSRQCLVAIKVNLSPPYNISSIYISTILCARVLFV